MKNRYKTGVGIVLSILLLWWALRDVSPGVVLHELQHADLLLLTTAVLVMLGGFVFRAVRWGVLLYPVAPRLPFRPRYAATLVGFAANNVFPARVGELARALSLARITAVSIAEAIATLVIERIFDGIVLVAFLFGTMATRAFPDMGLIAGVDPRGAALGVAVAMIVAVTLLFLLVTMPDLSLRLAGVLLDRLLPERWREPVLATMRSFLGGLAVLRSGRLFVLSVLLAAAQWLFTAGAIYLALLSFGIVEVPFVGAVFLQSLISLAVAVPSSPGFFGPFEAAAKLGLSLWGVDAGRAVSFAIGLHIGGFIPVTVIGFYYVWRLDLRWSEMRRGRPAAPEATS